MILHPHFVRRLLAVGGGVLCSLAIGCQRQPDDAGTLLPLS